MGLVLRPRLLMLQLCTVCKQHVDAHLEEDKVEQRWFGYEKYAVCVCCGQNAPDHENKAYRKRTDKFLKKKEG